MKKRIPLLKVSKLFSSIIFLFFFQNLIAQCDVSINPTNTIICNGFSSTLVATGGGGDSWVWSPSAGLNVSTGNTVIAAPSATTEYTVTRTCENGSTATASVTISVISLTVNAGADILVCRGNTINLTSTISGNAGNSVSYSWTGPNGFTSTSSSPIITNATTAMSGNYTVTATVGGCQAQNVVNVEVADVQITSNQFVNNQLVYCLQTGDLFGGVLINLSIPSYSSAITNYSIDWDNNGSADVFYDNSSWSNSIFQNFPVGVSQFSITMNLSNGCSVVKTYSVFVGSSPSPATLSLFINQATGCVPHATNWNLTIPTTNVEGTTYIFTWGDGTSFTYTHGDPIPSDWVQSGTSGNYVLTHIYNLSSCGSNVTLNNITYTNVYQPTVVTQNPCSQTPQPSGTGLVSVGQGPTASFTPSNNNVSPIIHCLELPLQLSNTSIFGQTLPTVGGASCSNTSPFYWTITPSNAGLWTASGLGTNNGQSSQVFWTVGSMTPSITFNAPGTYTVTLRVKNPCGDSYFSQTFCVQSKVTPSFTLSTPLIGCSPLTVTANSNGTNTSVSCSPVTYAWNVNYASNYCGTSPSVTYLNSTSLNSPNPTFQFNEAGVYSITLTTTNSCGSVTSAAQTVTVKKPPTVSIAPIASLCLGETVTPVITVNACSNLPISPSAYSWTAVGASPSASTSSTPPTFSYSTPGTYTISLSVTNECGTTTVNAGVNVLSLPIASAGIDQQFCTGGNAILGAALTGGLTYQWTPSTGLSSTTVANPTVNLTNVGTAPVTTSYTLTVTNAANCSATDGVLVTVNPLPNVTVSPSSSICIGSSTVLTAAGANTYSWSPAIGLSATTGATVTANPIVTTLYTVTGTNTSTGCVKTATVTVTVNPLPVVSAGADQTLCNQPIPVTLTGTPVGGTWSGPNITSGGIFTPTGTGTFTVVYTFTNTNNCTNSDNAIITVINPTNANAGPDQAICINSANIQLVGTPTGGSWSGSNLVSSAGLFTPSQSGTFNLIYSYGTGTCLSRDTMIMTVNPLPNVTVSPSSSICIGSSTVLTAAGANTYSWSPAIGLSATTGATVTANPIVTTLYTVTGTNTSTGCVKTATVTVTVNPLPVVSAGADQTLCNQPIPVTLTGTPVGGTWSGPNITSGGIFTPTGTGTFTVVYTFTNTNNCTNSDNAIITVINPTNANAGPDQAICINSANIQLVGTPTGGSWSGSNLVSSAGLFTPSQSGTFNLIYSYGSGTCLTRDTMVFTVHPLPTVDAGTDFSICQNGSSVSLIGFPAGGSWSGNGLTGSVFSPIGLSIGTQTLTYNYTNPVTNCSSSDQLVVTILMPPTVNAGVDQTLCNQPIAFFLSGSPLLGSWSGIGITNSTGVFTPNGNGIFTLTYSFVAANGCSNFDNVDITVISPTLANAGPNQEICINSPSLDVVGGPILGSWSGTGITSGGIFTPNTTGSFPLVYTVGSGTCLTTDTMIFTVNALPIVDAGQDVSICISASPINFTGTPAGGTWSGSGITDVNLGTFNPAILAAGAYPIVYSYTDPITTCVNTNTLIATVRPLPVPNFTFNPIACTNVSESFNNTSLLGNTYAWDFDDGGLSNLPSPSHIFTATGFPNVQLVVTSSFGCVDSISNIVEVQEPPTANFTLTPDSSCAPAIVNFTNLSSLIAPVYSWDFGNGQTSTLQNPGSQTYFQSIVSDTTYYIELAVTNFCGSSTYTESVVVTPSPTAIFGTNLDFGCSPFTLEIANVSLGLPDSFYWDFGDGTTSTDPSPFLNHVFTTGVNDTVYTIMLVATNECGVDTSYYDITVLPNIVTAFFNTDYISGCAPLSVEFTQYSVGANVYNWDFGDFNSSNTYNTSHVYTQAGTYTVSLMVTDGCSYDTATIEIEVIEPPVVDFISSPDSVCINQPFTFTNLSTGSLAATDWDFGDGGTSVTTNTQHAYTASGTYQVTLTGTSTVNSCTASVTKPVVVRVNPVADFTPNPISGCVPLTVSFANLSTSANFQTWNFGDGNFSTQFSPTHTFTSVGAYVVKLLVENTNGCIDSISKVINVYPVPTANFTVNPTMSCAVPVDVATTNLSTGAVNYNWNFGNGNFSTLTNPVITYNNPGTYTIQLTASNAYGCSDSHSFTVNIYGNPVADFILSRDTMCLGETINFISQSINADSVVWYVGDGNTFTGNTFPYQYGLAGVYDITAIAYGLGGCSDTLTLINGVVVNPKPIAGFDYVNQQDPEPLSGTIEFTNTSIGATDYLWHFGNAQSSIEENPIYRYNTYGDFLAELIVTNQFGCKDTIEQIIIVEFFSGLFVPNAIYPDHPAFGVANFLPKGIGLATYEILIYDDWGNLIWESQALDAQGRPSEYWDGTFNGVRVQQDAYVWKITATFIDTKAWRGKEYEGGKFRKSGTVTVIR